jgi:hypothetical protein
LGKKTDFTFNNFVNNYKIENTEKKAMLSDKLLLSKTLIEEYDLAIESPEILHIFNNESEIIKFNFDSLADLGFVIKANHGSGMNKIVKKDQIFLNEDLNRILGWFSFPSHLASRELHYKLISKRVFVEKLIGDNVTDYKLFCFEGRCRIIQLDFDRFDSHKRNFYSTDWNLLDFELVYGKNYIEIERPRHLDSIISMSEQISRNFLFVRVDWYLVENKIYLGELTFHPEGGVGPFQNKRQDIDFLNYLKLS